MAAIDESAREGLFAMGFPAKLGASVIEMAADDARFYDDAGKQLWDLQQVHELARAMDVQEAKTDAKALIWRWREQNPELVEEMLSKYGWFRSARVVSQLALQARRLGIRGQMASK